MVSFVIFTESFMRDLLAFVNFLADLMFVLEVCDEMPVRIFLNACF